ncbi:hypothetical protein NDI43_04590 [Microcoleus vaginatus GB2-A3]
MSFNEGRGKKEEGRRKREEGRGIDVKIFSISHSPHLPLSHSLAPSPPLPCEKSQDIAY